MKIMAVSNYPLTDTEIEHYGRIYVYNPRHISSDIKLHDRFDTFEKFVEFVRRGGDIAGFFYQGGKWHETK